MNYVAFACSIGDAFSSVDVLTRTINANPDRVGGNICAYLT